MFDFLKDWIMGIVYLVMFIAIIDLILPHNYGLKKYASIATGLIVVIAIMTPVFRFVSGNMNIQETLGRHISELDVRAQEANSKKSKEGINSETIQVFKDNLKTTMEREIYRSTGKKYVISKIDIEEDSDSIDFGSINGIELAANYSDGTVKPVDSVVIGRDEPKANGYRDEKVVAFLKDKFSVDPSVIKFKK